MFGPRCRAQLDYQTLSVGIGTVQEEICYCRLPKIVSMDTTYTACSRLYVAANLDI